MDGIGHYTQQILERIKGSKEYEAQCYSFPRLGKEGEFIYSSSMPYSFTVHALRAYLLGKKGICKMSKNIDIFHSTDYRIVPMDCPVVATIWDAVSLLHPEWFCNPIRHKISTIILKRATQYADRVIAPSEHAAQTLVDYFKIDSSRIEVVYWGIEDVWFSKISSEFSRKVLSKYALPNNYILSVGTLQPRKNF